MSAGATRHARAVFPEFSAPRLFSALIYAFVRRDLSRDVSIFEMRIDQMDVSLFLSLREKRMNARVRKNNKFGINCASRRPAAIELAPVTSQTTPDVKYLRWVQFPKSAGKHVVEFYSKDWNIPGYLVREI